MNKIPLIIDTDPGVDDALAIIMLAASDKVKIRAITATHGNVGLEATSKNALALKDFLDIDCVVAKGANRPMIVELKNASAVHGANGMAGYELPAPHSTFSHEAAWDVMYKLAKEENGEMVLMVLGPMTNVAIAILKYPDMKKYIKRIYMMGGSRSYGNHSQNAEFNIWGDPHACQVVLSSGIPITMADLIFGEDYPLNGKQLKRAYGGAKRLKGLMDALWAHEMSWIERAKERTGEDFDVDTFEFHIYDTTAAAALLLEDCLVTEDYYVVCETQGSETQGQTVFDYKGYSGKAPNVSLATQMDLGRYIQLLTDAIAHFE